MKRKVQYIFGVLCLLAVCMIAGILFSARTREEQDTREQQAAKELQMYTEFLEGKRSVDKWMITDLATVTGEPDKKEAVEYTMFDCDGDKLPELHVRTVKDYYIIDCNGEELYAWKYLYPQTEILNNGDFLYTHIGGAPLHYDYKYFSVDSHGEDDEVIRFSCYDDNEDGVFDEKDLYLGDDAEEITYKQWLKWKKKYLGVGMDEIIWKEISISIVKPDEAEKDVSGDQEPVDNISSNNNTDAYTVLKKAYEKIDFSSEFIPGEGKYNEEFLRLLRGEIPHVDSQSREKLTYYYYDADGDGVSELGISDEENYIYLFDYDEEQKRITLWKDLSSTWYRLMGTQKIYWNHGGTNILYSGVNQEGEEVEARFYSDEIFNKETKEAEIIYMVAYPKGIDETALEEIKSQAYYENQAYYFRVTQEQYDELTNRYFTAEAESREKSKEVGYSYQEIQELLQEKQEKDYSGGETYPYEVEQKTFSFSVDQGEVYHIPYVRVSGLQDKELQWKINHTLWENACWVLDCAELGDHLYSIFKDSIYMQITGVYKCANYLSVVYEGPSERGIEGHIAYAIVVDMLTGERVLMSDMVENPGALKELLLHYFDGDDRIMRLFITEEVANKILFYGSLTEKETVQNNVQSEDGEVDSVSWLFENASFYMTEEAFVILPGAKCFEPLYFPWEEVEGVISDVYSNQSYDFIEKHRDMCAMLDGEWYFEKYYLPPNGAPSKDLAEDYMNERISFSYVNQSFVSEFYGDTYEMVSIRPVEKFYLRNGYAYPGGVEQEILNGYACEILFKSSDRGLLVYINETGQAFLRIGGDVAENACFVMGKEENSEESNVVELPYFQDKTEELAEKCKLHSRYHDLEIVAQMIEDHGDIFNREDICVEQEGKNVSIQVNGQKLFLQDVEEVMGLSVDYMFVFETLCRGDEMALLYTFSNEEYSVQIMETTKGRHYIRIYFASQDAYNVYACDIADSAPTQASLDEIVAGNYQCVNDAQIKGQLEHIFQTFPEDVMWTYQDLNGDGQEDLVLQEKESDTGYARIIGIFAIVNDKVSAILWDDNDMTHFYELCNEGVLSYSQYYGIYENERYELYRFDSEWNKVFVAGMEQYRIEEMEEYEPVQINGNITMEKEGVYCWYYYEQDGERQYLMLTPQQWEEKFLSLFGKSYSITSLGISDWQKINGALYYICLGENGNKLKVCDMQTAETEEIDLGEYEPIQFHVRKDGAIGIWASKGEDKAYCFWNEQHVTYVPDEDTHKSWTYLRDYTEVGIILEREYYTSSMQGTKVYQIAEDGEITILEVK